MVVGHRIIFKGWKGGGEVARDIRDRLRWLSLPLLILVPVWWATTQLESLFFLSAELFIAAFFVTTVLILETVRVFLAHKFGLSERFLAALLYFPATVTFLLSVLQVDLLEGGTGYALGTILVFYISLHIVYAYLFQWVPWKHPLSQVLIKRLGPWVYLSILGGTLYFASFHFPGLVVDPATLAVFAGALVLLGVLIFSEALVASVFDFYFPVVKRSEVPALFRDLVRVLVCVTLLLTFVGLVLKRDLDSLLVGSAVITVSIGFALQETLGNFFAGLALRLSQPYALGDFIQVGEAVGRVDTIDWRQTAIYTFTGDHIILPNSLLAREPIKNYSSPSALHARDVRVRLHYRHPPNLVLATIREALGQVEAVFSNPAPEIHLLDFADFYMDYRIRYWINDYDARFQTDTKVRIALWYAFDRARLEIPLPIRTLVNQPAPEEKNAEEILGFLRTVDFLEALGEERLEVLARDARFQLFAAGEKICVQGEPGDCFYVIQSGRVEVTVKDEHGEAILNFEMAVGNYFGEMALLTGEPRSATVSAVTDARLLTVSKEDLRGIIAANPEVEKIVSDVLAQRQLRTEQAQLEAEEVKAVRGGGSQAGGSRSLEQLSEQLLRKIQAFFSY